MSKIVLNLYVYIYISKDITTLYIIAINNSSVENNGFEPLTPCVQGRCSSQLS